MAQYEVYRLPSYLEWFECEQRKSQSQIRSRLAKIEEEGYFGHVRNLDEDGDGLQELKFNDGRRIYFIVIPVAKVVLLFGGNKNGQSKDIKAARNVLAKARQRASS